MSKRTSQPQSKPPARSRKVVHHFCSGGIVIAKAEPAPNVALIEVDRGNKREWVIPKGHIEKGESREEAALREISEETGLRHLNIVRHLTTQRYSYRERGDRRTHHNTVYVYLVESSAPDEIGLHMDKVEHIVDARWFPLAEAKRIVAYPNNRRALAKLEEILRSA